MAINFPYGDSLRHGAVKGRSQVHNSKTDRWTKRDTETGRFKNVKSDTAPFNGIRREK